MYANESVYSEYLSHIVLSDKVKVTILGQIQDVTRSISQIITMSLNSYKGHWKNKVFPKLELVNEVKCHSRIQMSGSFSCSNLKSPLQNGR